jgi:hypothetical protein
MLRERGPRRRGGRRAASARAAVVLLAVLRVLGPPTLPMLFLVSQNR